MQYRINSVLADVLSSPVTLDVIVYISLWMTTKYGFISELGILDQSLSSDLGIFGYDDLNGQSC